MLPVHLPGDFGTNMIRTLKKWRVGPKPYTPPPPFDSGTVVPVDPIPSGIRPPIVSLSNSSGYTPAVMTKPPYLQWVEDTTFQSIYGYTLEYMRVTDATVFGVSSPYILDPGYSKQQNWNLDGTWFKIGNRTLLNGATARDGMVPFEYIKSMGTPSGTSIWSNIDPGLLWVFGSDKVTKFDPSVASAQASTTWMNLSTMGYTTESFTLGSAEGNISNDDRWAVLRVTKTSNGQIYWICVDLVNKVIRSEFLESNWVNGVNWVSVSQGGTRIVANQNNLQGKWMYDMDFNFLTNLGTGDHMDFGYEDEAGTVEIMTRANPPRMIRLQTPYGTRNFFTQSLIDSIWNGQAEGHSSGQATKMPGWSVHSFTNEFNPTKEIFAVKNDGSGQVMRFGSMRYTRYDYNGEPQASPNRELTMITFASDWNSNNQNGSVDTYIVRRKAD